MRHVLVAVTLALIPVLATGPLVAATTSAWGYGNYSAVTSGSLITIPMFDTQNGQYYLTGVTVSVYHTGNASFAVDNESRANRTYSVTPRETRSWSVLGPGVSSSTSYQWSGTTATLRRDDRDPPPPPYTQPDGYNWGRIGYSDLLNSSQNLNNGLYGQYQAAGGGLVNFTTNVTNISNTLVWSGGRPNSYAQRIQSGNPDLGISIRVDYNWEAVPEPGTWALMGLGLVGMVAWRWRTRKS